MPARCCVDNCMSGPFQLRAARVLFILNVDKMPISVVGVMSMLMKMVLQKDGSEFIVNVISNAGSYGYPYLQVIPVEGKVMTSGGLGVGYRPKYTFRKPSPQHSKGKGDSSSARHSARLSSTLPLTIDRERLMLSPSANNHHCMDSYTSKHVRMVMLSDYDCISKSVYNFGRYSVKRHKRTLRSHVISYIDIYIYMYLVHNFIK